MKKVISSVLLSLASVASQAAVVYLQPLQEPFYAIGDSAKFELKYDFSDDRPLGGGIDVFFDPAGLEVVSWTPNDLGDPTFRRAPSQKSGELDGIAFGDFNGLPEVANMGVLTFKVLAAGTFEIRLAADSTGWGGDFVSATSFQKIGNVEFRTVSVTAVPLPATAWLFVTGMSGFMATHRRKSV